MNGLREALNQYLGLRRALGFKLLQTGRSLLHFVRFAEQEGATSITTDLALQWAQEDGTAGSVTHSDRLAMVRRFATWRSVEDPQTQIPSEGLLPRRYRRPAPYIYSDEEVRNVVSTAGHLPSKSGLRGLTCSTMFGLLAVTGMRISEAVGLDRGDVDLRIGVLTIREGKRGKSRVVPIHATTRDALETYSQKRDALLGTMRTSAFFVSDRRTRISAFCAGENFIEVSRKTGLRPPAPDGCRGRGPRLHDFRHRFAVSTLIRWYQSGADVDREIPKLATYLGHKGANEVYWYLQAVPELLELATLRSEEVASGGAS